MTKLRRENLYAAIAWILFLLAYTPGLLWWMHEMQLPQYATFISNAAYVGLLSAYGYTLHKRIIQTQVKRFLIAIVVLMVFWILIRTIKYHIVRDPALSVYFWYAYYIPMLLIPSLFLLVALSLGKPENYRLPLWTGMVLLISSAFILLVFTNDFHQLVFLHSAKADKLGITYSYEILYWFLLGWELAIALASILMIIGKCRVPKTRKLLWRPLVPLGFSLLYIISYIMKSPILQRYARDMTTSFCLLLTVALESYIRCGLIQSNRRYQELFHASTIGAQITDIYYQPVFSSSEAKTASPEILRQTQTAPVVLEGGLRLSGAPVQGGYVIWQEDVSVLTRRLEELAAANKSLQNRNKTLQEEYVTRRKRQRLEEQNRLYDKMQAQTAGQLHLLSWLTDRLEDNPKKQEEKRLLAKIAVISTYIKRRNNLIFLSENQSEIAAPELEYCIRESMQNLTLFGILCEYRFDIEGTLPFASLMHLYDVFEAVLEKTFDSLSILYLFTEREGNRLKMILRLATTAELSHLGIQNLKAESEEEGEWHLTFSIPQGGASV